MVDEDAARLTDARTRCSSPENCVAEFGGRVGHEAVMNMQWDTVHEPSELEVRELLLQKYQQKLYPTLASAKQTKYQKTASERDETSLPAACAVHIQLAPWTLAARRREVLVCTELPKREYWALSVPGNGLGRQHVLEARRNYRLGNQY